MRFDRLVKAQTGASLSPCGATVPHVCKPVTRSRGCWGAEGITGTDSPPAAAIELDPDTVPTACPDPARPDDHFSILSLCTAVLDITTSLPDVLVVPRLCWWCLVDFPPHVCAYLHLGGFLLPPNKKTRDRSDTATYISLRMFPGEWPTRP